VALRLAIAFGLGYLFWRVRSVLVAIILAAVLTYAILPIVDFLCSRQVRGISRRFQRIIATLLVFVVLIGGVIALLNGKQGIAVACGFGFMILMFIPKILQSLFQQ
jgi:predicted PurR-regulated permease PerM